MRSKVTLLLVAFFGTFFSQATTYYSKNNGQWSNSRNGSNCSCTPQWWNANDTVVLTSGSTLTDLSGSIAPTVIVESGAQWRMSNTSNFQIYGGNSFTVENGGTFRATNNINIQINNGSLIVNGQMDLSGKGYITVNNSGIFSSGVNSHVTIGDDAEFISNGNGTILIGGDLEVDKETKITANGGEIKFLSTADARFKKELKVTGNGGTFVNQGTIDARKDVQFTANNNGSLELHGVMNVRSGQDIKFKVYGDISGTMQINGGKSPEYTVQGGSINGMTQVSNGIRNWSTMGSPVVKWNGSSWSHGGTLSGNLEGKVEANFSTQQGGSLNGNKITVDAGVTMIIENGDSLALATSVVNHGVIVFECGAQASEAFSNISGSGDVVIKACFTRTGWHTMGFPVKGNANVKLSDLVGTNLNLTYSGNATNIYTWDANTSGWAFTNGNANVGGQSFNIYVKNVPAELSLTLRNSEFANQTESQDYTYSNPTGNPANGTGWASTQTDGWNMLYNPFQSHLDWDEVAADMGMDFNGTAVYIWDGTQYQTYNTGSSNANRFVAPHQAFFVRTNPNANGTFTFNSDHRTTQGSVSFFRTQMASSNLILELQGDNKTLTTEIVENANATGGFDHNFDAYFMMPSNGVPAFFTVSEDSLALSINQINNFRQGSVYVSLGKARDGVSYTIQIPQNNLHANVTVMLEDLYTGTMTDLTQGGYTFTYRDNAPVQRFKLHFSATHMSVSEANLNSFGKVWASADGVEIELNETANHLQVEVFDLGGSQIYSGEMTRMNQLTLPISQTGMLIVRLSADGQAPKVYKIIRP